MNGRTKDEFLRVMALAQWQPTGIGAGSRAVVPLHRHGARTQERQAFASPGGGRSRDDPSGTECDGRSQANGVRPCFKGHGFPFGMAVRSAGDGCLFLGDSGRYMPDGSVVVWSGELYPEVDDWAERIYALYRAKGMDFPLYLDGAFAIVIWDAQNRHTIVTRDPVGVVPLYECELGDALLVSDHIDGLLALGYEAEVDWEAVADFFCFFWTLGDKTFFRGVRRFPAGAVSCGVTRSRYWSYIQEGTIADMESAVRELRAALARAIDKRLVLDQEVGCHLSGGVDSSVLAILLSNRCGGLLRTLSIRVDGGNDETPWVERMLVELNGDHSWVEPGAKEVIWAVPKVARILGEPMCYPSVLSRYFLDERSSVLRIFNGRGVDELFSGYTWHLPPHLDNHLARRTVFQRDTILRILPCLGDLAYDPVEVYMDLYQEFPGYGPLERTLHVDYHTLLRSWLAVEYFCSRAFHHMALMPALDKDVVKLAAGINSSHKANEQEAKIVFRRAFADILPGEILSRTKVGLNMPFSAILRGDGAETARAWVWGAEKAEFPEMEFGFVREMFLRHLRGEVEWGWQFWAILLYMHWKRSYVLRR